MRVVYLIGAMLLADASHAELVPCKEMAVIAPLLRQVEGTAGKNYAGQLREAIHSSAQLCLAMKRVTATGLLKGLVVKPRRELTSGLASLFGGYVEDHRIVLATEYLDELKNDRLYDVVMKDDILPNNTEFVIAHLVYHVENPVQPSQFRNPIQYGAAALDAEARAFIYAWNTTLETAEVKNKSRPLSASQATQLLMNLRYRFALMGAIGDKDYPLTFLPSSKVEPDAANVKAIVNVLRRSHIADLQ